MFFSNWFSNKKRPRATSTREEQKAAARAREKPSSEPAARAENEAAPTPGNAVKVKRHARREQLYVAIREAMTRSGVLSSGYKFKVLSLDQRGNEFLVMMDLSKASSSPFEQLHDIEALIIQNARSRFEITVPAVYWRTDEIVRTGKSRTEQPEVTQAAPAVALAKPRHEPIHADEVAAFRQALLAASANAPAAAGGQGAKAPRTAHSYTLLTGFEDTEMPPAAPALSTTQYGDLN